MMILLEASEKLLLGRMPFSLQRKEYILRKQLEAENFVTLYLLVLHSSLI